MAFIKSIEVEEATGKVAEIFQTMNDKMGFIPGSFKTFGQSEFVLSQQFSNIAYFSRNMRFSGKLLAFIRLLVSDKEKCKYCVTINTGILFQYGILPEQVNEIIEDPTKVLLDDNEKELLFFVLKVVKDSNSIVQEDVDKLVKLGWTEADILEATYHGASQVAGDMLLNAFRIE